MTKATWGGNGFCCGGFGCVVVGLVLWGFVVCLAYVSTSLFIIQRSQGRNLGQELTQAMEERCSACFLIGTRTISPGVSLPTVIETSTISLGVSLPAVKWTLPCLSLTKKVLSSSGSQPS